MTGRMLAGMSDLPDKPISKPVPESDRWSENRALHYLPEKEQSGNLPDQPVGNEVDALDGAGMPWKNLTTGR